MATVTSPTPATADSSAVQTELIFRLSVEQYHEMIRVGILDEDEPVELLEGWLVKKMPKHPPHSTSTRLVLAALNKCLPPGWEASSQEPITTDTSEPEPDVSVARGDSRQYASRHPGPKDLAMTVEVADSTLDRDRGWKKRIYARARIPVYWIINLVDCKIEVYSVPTGPSRKPDYRRAKEYGPPEQIPLVIDGKTVAQLKVRDLLP